MKTITMPQEEYENELKNAKEQAFNNGVKSGVSQVFFGLLHEIEDEDGHWIPSLTLNQKALILAVKKHRSELLKTYKEYKKQGDKQRYL